MDLSTRFRRARGRRGAGEDVDVDADADRRMRVTFMVVEVVRDERRFGSGLDVILRVRAVCSNKSVENSWEMGIDYYIWMDEVPLNEWLRLNF